MLHNVRHQPHPPTHTLFPYTTLFRSDNDRLLGIVTSRDLLLAESPRAPVASVMTGGEQLVTAPVGTSLDEARDRKSTRLNSSHMSISYAVFCLKKKRDLATETLQRGV